MTDVVATMGCSTRLAEMRFREVTGKTIREAIADIRMERAVVLLKGGATPIGDIAQACGYGTEAALRIAFRKRFGQSMRAWRNATAYPHGGQERGRGKHARPTRMRSV